MLLRHIQKAILGEKDKAVAGIHPLHSQDPHAMRSLLIFGHGESTFRLTLMEAIRDAVRQRPDRVCGVVFGLGFDRLERTLTGIGFDTTHRLLAMNTSRSLMRFEEPKTGAAWHLTSSELRRIGNFPELTPHLTPGNSYRIDPEINFSDWIAIPSGKMRHIHTGKLAVRPEALIFRESFYTPGSIGYDGLEGDHSDEEILSRLKQFRQLGLNATIFIRSLLQLIRSAGLKLDTPIFHTLMTDATERARLLEHLAPYAGSKPPFSAKSPALRAAFEAVRELHDNVPPMAITLARELYKETYRDREILATSDLLVPGKLRHIAVDNEAGAYLAFCVKRDLQKLALDRSPGEDLVMIVAEKWEELADPERDSRCLARADIFQAFGISRYEKFEETFGEAAFLLTRAFPRHSWHISPGRAEAALFDKLYPYIAHARQQLAYLAWEKRLEEVDGKLREKPVDLDVDGMEVMERSRQSKLKRTIERSGFAID